MEDTMTLYVIRGDSVTAHALPPPTISEGELVVRSIEGGMRQVVIAAAGYDGRALRYAKPGVAWFELDHPDTQRDKRERLERLDIDASGVTFVAADFDVDDIAAAMADAGHDKVVPSLILCEGVAVYLAESVLESLLRGVRAIAAPGSCLAISMSVDTGAPDLAAQGVHLHLWARGGRQHRHAVCARKGRQ